MSEFGEFNICRWMNQSHSDGFNFFTLAWGFESLEGARRGLTDVSKEFGIPADELCVVAAMFDFGDEVIAASSWTGTDSGRPGSVR